MTTRRFMDQARIDASIRKSQIARDAGLDPNLIPEDDFSIEGDTITYRYMLLDADGKMRSEGNRVLRSGWMTAKIGRGK